MRAVVNNLPRPPGQDRGRLPAARGGPMGRGRIDTRTRWHMVRRQGGFSLPSAVAERLEGALQGFGNRDAAAALARLLALAHRRYFRPFAVCRRALSRIVDLGLSEDQVRG